MRGELRNLCLYDPDTDESVTLLYLACVDCGISGDDLIGRFGRLSEIGWTNTRGFMELGIYPLKLSYEKAGKTVRAREFVLKGLLGTGGNIVKAEGGACALLWKMGRKRKAA